MIIRKDSEAYKEGIVYTPNVNTLARNSEKASKLLGIDYHEGFFHKDSYHQRLPPGVLDDLLDPIEKKIEW